MKNGHYDDFDIELDDFVDDFGEVDTPSPITKQKKGKKIQPIHSDKWTIVEAFNTINEHLPKSKLSKELFILCAEAYSFLAKELGFNAIQCTFIAMLVEFGKPMSFRMFGKTLGLSRLSMMVHTNDLEDLFKKRWLLHKGACEQDGMYEGYGLAYGVVTAIRENRTFVPEDLKCDDTQEFVEVLAAKLTNTCDNNRLEKSDTNEWIKDFVIANKELPVCKTALTLSDSTSISILMLIIADYCLNNETENEGIDLHMAQMGLQIGGRDFYRHIIDMRSGRHELFVKGLIEHKCDDGIADTETYVATAHLKREILADFTPTKATGVEQPRMNGLKSYKDITPKSLYYNKEEEKQVLRLSDILSKDQLPLVQKRLDEQGMRTGICVLMYGEPGTGKTATAYELARQTNRDIIQVQVTDFMDKYVGESESKLKAIFRNYRNCCKNSESKPILLLNEGDAILSKRTSNIERIVDKMSNALQNILLEEMENLDGIMIVTTNMIVNLDSAFERRFIYKIQFNKPGKDVKARIWKSMAEELTEDECVELADMFDISGGEIENITRKATMEYILTGEKPNVEMLKNFAKEEKLKTSTRPTIGFNK